MDESGRHARCVSAATRTDTLAAKLPRIRFLAAQSGYKEQTEGGSMGLKEGLDKLGDEVKDKLHDAKDTLSEVGHRGAADAEHAKREVAGDQMTVGENLGSMWNEGKNRVEAEVDVTKRDARNLTKE
ncbi:MAG: hypothetical protein GIW95_12785 [Candidatus Eremiobacteraeota bacterium]|nr:hypothetical protein [Candidatus Eremiobacteraeota bacterium]